MAKQRVLGSNVVANQFRQEDIDGARFTPGAIYWNRDLGGLYYVERNDNDDGQPGLIHRQLGMVENYYSVLQLGTALDLSVLTVGSVYTSVVDTDLDWEAGDRAIFEATRDAYFSGIVQTYDKDTGAFAITIDSIVGTGSYTVFVSDRFDHIGIDTGANINIIGTFTNYAALVADAPTANIGDIAYVNEPQGTAWLPGSFGGSYRPRGYYLYVADADETTPGNQAGWQSDRNLIARTLSQTIGNEIIPGTYTVTDGTITIPTNDGGEVILNGFGDVEPGGNVVVVNPTATQEIVAPVGTRTIFRGSFDLEDRDGDKAFDFSGTSGDSHWEHDGQVFGLIDKDQKRWYYDPTNTTDSFPTGGRELLEVATLKDVSGLQVVRIDTDPETVPFRAIAWISNTESYINDTGLSVANVTTSTNFGAAGWLRLGDGGSGPGNLTLHEGTDSSNTTTFQHYYLSSDGGTTVVGNPVPVGADEIVATTIQRNSAGQDLAEWVAAGNAAGDFEVDSTQAETFVSLARDETLLDVVRETKMEVATENGNNYHYDLLRFIALNGRLVLQTDNLVSALAAKVDEPTFHADTLVHGYVSSAIFINDDNLATEEVQEKGLHLDVDGHVVAAGEWEFRGVRSDGSDPLVLEVDQGSNGDIVMCNSNGEPILTTVGSSGGAFLGDKTVANNQIATLGDITGTGASLEERFVPNGDNLFTIGGLHKGSAGTAPANTLYFRASSTDNTKLDITDFSQLVSGNQILFDLPDGSADDGPGNATLTALQNGGTLFISSGTASAEIAIVGIAGDPAVAGGNKRFTLGSVTKSTGTVSTDASTSFSMSTTARSDFYSDGDLVSFIPSAANLEGLRLGSSAATAANRAELVLGFGSTPGATVQLEDSEIGFTIINSDATANDQYIHMIGGGGDLGFDVTGLDNEFTSIHNSINSIIQGGSGQSTFEFPDDNPAFITGVLVDETRFTDENGNKSATVTNVDTAAPQFRPSTGHLTLIYSNLTDTEINQLQAATGNDLAFRTTAGGIVTTGNVENAPGTAAAQKTYHFDFRSVDYRLGTGRRQLNFVLRDADEAADFATAFTFVQNTGLTGSADFLYIPTDGPLVTNLIDNIALVTRVDVGGGGSSIAINEVAQTSVDFRTDTSGDSDTVRGVTFTVDGNGVVNGSVNVNGIGSGAQGNSVTVENVQSGANPGDTSTFDLQIVDGSGADVGSPVEVTIQPGVAGGQGFQGFSTVFAFGFALTNSDTDDIAPTGGTGITIPPDGTGVSNGTGIFNRWSFAPVDTNNNPNPATFSIWVVPGTFNPATNNILWGTPFIASGEAGQPGGLGPAGPGVAPAGTTNQLLVKLDDATDTFNTGWTSDITINRLNSISAYKALIPTILLGTRGNKSAGATVQGVPDVTIQSFTRGTETHYLYRGIVIVDETQSSFTYAAGRALVADSNDLTTATNIANLIG